jgi:hypothetical protein
LPDDIGGRDMGQQNGGYQHGADDGLRAVQDEIAGGANEARRIGRLEIRMRSAVFLSRFRQINGARIAADAKAAYVFIAGLYETNDFTFEKLTAWLRDNVEPASQ